MSKEDCGNLEISKTASRFGRALRRARLQEELEKHQEQKKQEQEKKEAGGRKTSNLIGDDEWLAM